MKNVLAITLTILSVAAFGAHAGLSGNTQSNEAELAVKAIGNGAISFGMSANQIEKAIS